MTVIVGILCEDGVVLGADSALTYGPRPGGWTMEHPGALKLEVIGSIVTGTAGSVGLGQRANQAVQALSREGALDRPDVVECGRVVSRVVIEDFKQTVSADQVSDKGGGWGLGMLLGLVTEGKPQLIEFDPSGFHPEVKGYPDPSRGDRVGRFATLGSGQVLADPFLAHAYKLLFGDRIPTVARARLAVAWTIEHVIRYNVGGVGGDLKLAVLECRDGIWRSGHVDAGETRMQLAELEKHVSLFGQESIDHSQGQDIEI